MWKLERTAKMLRARDKHPGTTLPLQRRRERRASPMMSADFRFYGAQMSLARRVRVRSELGMVSGDTHTLAQSYAVAEQSDDCVRRCWSETAHQRHVLERACATRRW